MLTRHKKLLIILLSIIAVIVVATVIVFVLIQITPKPPKLLNPKEIVTGLEEALKSGSAKSYVFQPSAPDNYMSIYVKSTSSSTILLTTTRNLVEFSKDSIVPIEELDRIEMTISSYLKQNDFIESNIIDSTTMLLRYSRPDVDCQLNRFILPDNVTTFKLACIDRADAASELKEIDTLLSLWGEQGTFDYISQDSISDATYELRMLSAVTVANPEKLHTLLFVNDKVTWKYLGDASQGDASLSNSKYILNSDITTAMADPGYGSLVTKLFPTTKK